MDDYFSKSGRRFIRFSDLAKGALGRKIREVKLEKKNILITAILILGMGLFFSVWFNQKVYARQKSGIKKEITLETIDPLNKFGKGYIQKINLKKDNSSKKKENENKKKEVKEEESADKREKRERENRIREMVKNHPIEDMAGIISERDEKTAAFLVAIARKESSWGLHAPHAGTRDCFNYWGYKGSYKLNMGYSCFDSKEQAVEVVGDKIKSLIDRKIDTPERFVVWKCGSSCAGHDPAGVQKWISDVRGIFYKLNS